MVNQFDTNNLFCNLFLLWHQCNKAHHITNEKEAVIRFDLQVHVHTYPGTKYVIILNAQMQASDVECSKTQAKKFWSQPHVIW